MFTTQQNRLTPLRFFPLMVLTDKLFSKESFRHLPLIRSLHLLQTPLGLFLASSSNHTSRPKVVGLHVISNFSIQILYTPPARSAAMSTRILPVKVSVRPATKRLNTGWRMAQLTLITAQTQSLAMTATISPTGSCRMSMPPITVLLGPARFLIRQIALAPATWLTTQ